jgi:hypothetical protein
LTDLETHIQIFKSLGFIKHRNALIRMIFHIAREHPEIKDPEDFIKQISQKTINSNPVEPLKAK